MTNQKQINPNEEFVGIVQNDNKAAFMFVNPDGSTRMVRIYDFKEIMATPWEEL